MTVLGKHTIDETRQLMRTIEFRIDRAQALVNRLPFTNENVKLVKEWNEFVEVRWKNAHDQALNRILLLKINNPLIREDLVPAEGEFNLVMKARNQQGEGVIVPGDLTDLVTRLEKGSGEKLDEEGAPPPPGFDPDIEAFKKADATIKSGEAAAQAAKEAADKLLNEQKDKAKGGVLSLIPWWVWGIGGAVTIGAGYSVYKTGTQVAEKAKRDTAYIHETMTSKVLPGYKG